MEKHYVHPTGMAAGLTAGIVYVLCALFVTLMPWQAMRFFSDWFHGIDLTQIMAAKQLTAAVFIRGLIEIVLFFYILGIIYAWVYNSCVRHCKRKGWI